MYPFIIHMMMQDGWSPVMFYICNFHDTVMLVVIMTISMVFYIMVILVMLPCCNRLFFGNEALEILWTSIPSMVLVMLSLPSLLTLYMTDEVNNPLITVKVLGNQWFWSYEYSDFEGVEFNSYMIVDSELMTGDFRLLEVDNNVVLPVDTEIRVIVSSVDVIHSWTIPSMGAKVDATPGRLNQLVLYIDNIGLTYGQCSEICGSNHSFMPICIESVVEEAFFKWLEE